MHYYEPVMYRFIPDMTRRGTAYEQMYRLLSMSNL